MDDTIGFIGLGVMGEPMCRNLALRSGKRVVGFDLSPEPSARLAEAGVARAGSALEVLAAARTVFLSLPGGREVEQVCLGPHGLVSRAQAAHTVVDLSTSPPALARRLYEEFEGRAAAFADAPVARTRQAAVDGTLSVTVGATESCFERIEPLLRCVASEVTRCGSAGAGQAVKILNNMVLFQTGVALAEALAIGRRAGLDGKVLFDALAKGSADSFALRNHGMKAMLPGVFPERAFSAEYALKDLSYAIDMAEASGLSTPGADGARMYLERAIELGHGKAYWPAILKALDEPEGG